MPQRSRSRSKPKRLLGGIACGVSGVALIVCRYVYLPLDLGLSSTTRAVINGVMAALVVVGVQIARTAWRDGERATWRGYLTALGLPVFASMFLVAKLAPWVTPDKMPALHPIKLPGLTVSMPAWTAEQSGSAWQFGARRLADPRGSQRFMELRWALSEPMEADAASKMLGGGQLEVVSKHQVQVASQSVETMYLETPLGGKRMAFTQFRCPDDPRSMMLVSFLNFGRDALIGLHQQILRSVRCEPDPEAASTAVVFPRFDPPAGCQRQEATSALVYECEQGEIYEYTAGMPGRELLDKLQMVPGMVQQLMKEEFELQRVDPPSAPRSSGDPPRALWQTKGHDASAGDVDLLLAAWYCKARDQSFIGLYIAPAAAFDDVEARRTLVSVQCP